MDLEISFPGGKRVDARGDGFVIHTDQSIAHGGDGSAPEPFDLFLASLATCAGLYVLAFCRTRNLPTTDIRLIQHTASDDKGKLLRVTLEIHVPASFPRQWLDPIARAAASCKVKKTLSDPPSFDVATIVDNPAAAA